MTTLQPAPPTVCVCVRERESQYDTVVFIRSLVRINPGYSSR